MDTDDPFKDRELEVWRLCRENTDFAETWHDYQDVQEVLRRLRTRSDAPAPMVDDYTRLLSELYFEIEEWLPSRFGRVGQHDNRE